MDLSDQKNIRKLSVDNGISEEIIRSYLAKIRYLELSVREAFNKKKK